MDNQNMNSQLGRGWFIFYTKVRPWFACLLLVYVSYGFIQDALEYTRYWWMMLYLILGITNVVLSVMVFVKSFDIYNSFVRFVKGALLLETVYISCIPVVLYGKLKLWGESFWAGGIVGPPSLTDLPLQNTSNDAVEFAVVAAISLFIAFFTWYRLNLKYFNERVILSTCPVDRQQ